jgi:hypothetical protein
LLVFYTLLSLYICETIAVSQKWAIQHIVIYLLLGQAHYHMSHSTSLLFVSYFWDRVPLHAWASLNCVIPISTSLNSWDNRCMSFCPIIGWNGVSGIFSRAEFEPLSFQSLPLERLGLQIWATVFSQHLIFFNSNICQLFSRKLTNTYMIFINFCMGILLLFKLSFSFFFPLY